MVGKVTASPGYVTVRESSRAAQLLTLVFIALAVRYLWWRTFESLNLDAPLVSIPFLVADYVGFGFFLLFAFQLWSRVRHEAFEPEQGLSVDVFIPTYNEDPIILRSTIVAALNMRYPHETYVLDDGRRPEVEQLCAELGARYLTRPDNKGAKAGNINAALPKTSGDFIAIFDADHAPFANFLTDLLGYFRDPQVALAQAPQEYYNLDSFQHFDSGAKSESLRHEQSVFFEEMLPGKDRHNAVFWCGSTAIVRRSALEEVGGVDTRTITEDMHTAMSMHARGWKSVYHARPLAVGIAPDDPEAFLVQRLRWARGAVQILRRDNPMKKAGLSLGQRLSYTASVAYVFEYIPKAIYLLTPVVALFLGALPMSNMGWLLLWYFLPYYIAGLAANQLLTRGTAPLFTTERFYALKMWIMLRAALTLVVPGNPGFQVTPKTGDGDAPAWQQLRPFKWQLTLGAMNALAVLWAFAGWWFGMPWRLGTVELFVTAGWALFNAGMIAYLFRLILKRHHRRKVYRFRVDVPARILRRPGEANAELTGARLSDISAMGAGLIADEPLEAGERIALSFADGRSLSVRADARVTVCRKAASGGYAIGASFEGLSSEAERRLILFVYQQYLPLIFGYRHIPSDRELAQIVPMRARDEREAAA